MKKILTSILALGILFSLCVPNIIGSNEVKAQTVTDPTQAPADWAFTANSVSLHDAILDAYSGVDKNSDGYISISEAATLTGGLSLSGKEITGTLDGIEYFTQVIAIYLNNNSLEGEIPAGISNITSLRTLTFENNKLSGSIPSSITSLGSLTTLNLGRNQLTGSIPTTLGSLSSLTSLTLYNNQLSGEIPASIGSLSGLTTAYLNGNKLTGSIPSTIGALTQLKTLNLNDNLISGSIPTTIGGIAALETFAIERNNVSGSLPQEIGSLGNLKYLYLSRNNISGTLPTTITQLSNLVALNIDNNSFSGSLPSNIGNLTKLSNLNILNNNFSGELPTSLYTITTLTEVTLSDNELLSGDPTTGFENHPSLQRLSVQNTQLNQKKPTSTVLQIHLRNMMNEAGDDIDPTISDEDLEFLINSINTITTMNPASGTKYDELLNFITVEKEIYEIVDTANKALDELYNADGTLKDGVTQEDLDKIKDLVDTLPDGAAKDRLEKEIEDVQTPLNNQSDAVEKVDNLFTDDTFSNIKDTTTQAMIDDAQEAVDKLDDGQLKTDLQSKLNNAQKLLNQYNEAKDAVNNLFDQDGKLKESVLQSDIDDAQKLVDALPNGTIKDELQTLVSEAQTQYDANKLNTDKPIQKPPVEDDSKPILSKPSIDGSSTTVEKASTAVKTADTTNNTLYFVMLVSSLAVLGMYAKKRKAVK